VHCDRPDARLASYESTVNAESEKKPDHSDSDMLTYGHAAIFAVIYFFLEREAAKLFPVSLPVIYVH